MIPRALNILVVEDHVDSASALAALLRNHGHRAIVVHAAEPALALSACSRFDLLLTDIALPDGDGRTLLADIRKRYEIAAIAVSGYCMNDDVARSLEAGFAAHLSKPLRFTELMQHINALAASNGDGAARPAP